MKLKLIEIEQEIMDSATRMVENKGHQLGSWRCKLVEPNMLVAVVRCRRCRLSLKMTVHPGVFPSFRGELIHEPCPPPPGLRERRKERKRGQTIERLREELEVHEEAVKRLRTHLKRLKVGEYDKMCQEKWREYQEVYLREHDEDEEDPEDDEE